MNGLAQGARSAVREVVRNIVNASTVLDSRNAPGVCAPDGRPRIVDLAPSPSWRCHLDMLAHGTRDRVAVVSEHDAADRMVTQGTSRSKNSDTHTVIPPGDNTRFRFPIGRYATLTYARGRPSEPRIGGFESLRAHQFSDSDSARNHGIEDAGAHFDSNADGDGAGERGVST